MSGREINNAGFTEYTSLYKQLPVEDRLKREHEAAAYAEVRKDRGAAPISVRELREEWQRLLMPSRGRGRPQLRAPFSWLLATSASPSG